MSVTRQPLAPSLLGHRAVIACLVAAPALEVVETLLSPLKDTSTAADLVAIDAHRGLFVASVVAGLAATMLFVPAFLGLARATVASSPVAARIGGGVAVVSMMGFAGVRGIQAVLFETVRRAMPAKSAAALIDGVPQNTIGAVVLAAFLGGSVIGTIALAVAAWRAGLPRVPAALLVAFPFVDLAAGGHIGTVVSHVVLLVALAWLAAALSRGMGAPSAARPVPVPA